MDHTDLVGLTDQELLKLAPEATHQHFKGGLYRFLGPAKSADTGDYIRLDGHPAVAYMHLFPHKVEVWVRKRGEWASNVKNPNDPGRWIPRFRELDRSTQLELDFATNGVEKA